MCSNRNTTTQWKGNKKANREIMHERALERNPNDRFFFLELLFRKKEREMADRYID